MTGARSWIAGGVTLAIACALSACAAPDYTYAQLAPSPASAGNVYFKVPHSWTEFSPEDIAAAQSSWTTDSTAKNLLAATAWQDAYDASAQPSVSHVLSAQTPDAPTVFASLRSLFEPEKSAATDSSLRDMVVRLSTLGSSVKILKDLTVSQGAAHGVHVIYSFVPAAGGDEETIDQTALFNGGKNAVYLLLVRCSSKCYQQNRDAIESVTASYTIQEDQNG